MTDSDGNQKVYIQEYIDIIGHNRANYMHHMTANWSPIAQEERNQLCYGVWAVLGTTRGWPEVMNMWEEDGFEGIATSFRHEVGGHGAQDPKLAKWWAKAAEFRWRGKDRLLIPHPTNRTITQLCADGVSGEAHAWEHVHLEPGTSGDFVERVLDQGVEQYGRFGFELAGAWRVAMVNDAEAMFHWVIPTWEHWAELERAQDRDDKMRAYRRGVDDSIRSALRFLMVDAPLSPFKSGRQPLRSDRTDWED